MSAERARLGSRLTGIRDRIDAAYIDKLDGKISEEFWRRKTDEWTIEEHQATLAIDSLANAEIADRSLDAERVFELAIKAYSLYVSQDSAEKAKLLRLMCSNFSVDGVTVTPTYR